MRLVMFDNFQLGALQGSEVVYLNPALGDIAALPWDERVPALAVRYAELQPTLERQTRSGGGIPLSAVRLRAPNPRPPKLLSAIGNYGEKPPEGSPLAVDFTFKSPESVIGPGDTVVLGNRPAEHFEVEATLAVVIGREAYKVAAAGALSFVFGYTPFLDVFAAGLGRVNIGTFFGKSMDTFGPMGPAIVTPDELGDPNTLDVRLTVNGTIRQSYNTSDMAITVAEVIEAATGIMTLYPGDVVTCGSPVESPIVIHGEDEIYFEIDRIGGSTVHVSEPAGRNSHASVR
jgi:2-keto-4-pentenoate hydratase/2-oxohepta-3-ene-1,7-dioic acid hydratase in catechol pathway